MEMSRLREHPPTLSETCGMSGNLASYVEQLIDSGQELFTREAIQNAIDVFDYVHYHSVAGTVSFQGLDGRIVEYHIQPLGDVDENWDPGPGNVFYW
jgi:hypothetical protein